MASRISQMRNGMQTPQQPAYQQQVSSQTIENTKRLMAMVKSAPNPQQALAQMLQTNPNTAMISNLLKGGDSLETIARQMAQQRGIDINQLINQLGGT